MNYKNTILSIFCISVLGGTPLSFTMQPIVPADKKERATIDQSVNRFNFSEPSERGGFFGMFPEQVEQEPKQNSKQVSQASHTQVSNVQEKKPAQNIHNNSHASQNKIEEKVQQKQPVSNNKTFTKPRRSNQPQVDKAQNQQVALPKFDMIPEKTVDKSKSSNNNQKQIKPVRNNDKQVPSASQKKSMQNTHNNSQVQVQNQQVVQEKSVAVISKEPKIIDQPTSQLAKPLVKSEVKEKKPIKTTYDLFRACARLKKDLDEGEEINLDQKDINKIGDEYERQYINEEKTALHYAAQNGLINMVKALVKADADPNAEDSEDALFTNAKIKRTALHYAVQNGHMEVVKFLLDNGAKIDKRDSQGNTTLHYAVSSLRDNSEMIRFVIEKDPTSVKATNNNLETPLHDAVLSRNESSVEILLENNADAKAKDKKQLSPLHYYDQGHVNNIKIMKLLVKKGADPDTRFSSGWNPLLSAIQDNDMELIELLVEKKADVHAKDDFDNTVLRYAALSSNPKILKFLLENTDIKKDINIKDGIQGTPLWDMCRTGNYENAKILIGHGADVNAKGRRTWKPSPDLLMEFSWAPNIKKPEIDEFSIDPFVYPKAENGYTPLHIASYNGHDDIVELLLTTKNIDKDIKTNNHVTPLHAAAQQGHVSIVEKLLKAGANPNAETIEMDVTVSVPETEGRNYVFGKDRYTAKKITPVFAAILGGKTEVVKRLTPLVNVNHTVGSFKATALHLASYLGHSDIVKIIAEDKRTDFDLLLRGKHTASDIAHCYGKADIVDFLDEKINSLKRMFTISLGKTNDNKACIKTIKNNGTLQKPISIQLKSNIRADLPLMIKEQKPKLQFNFSCSLDNGCTSPGIYYRKNGGIQPVLANLQKQMVCNHLSDLNYHKCEKMGIIEDFRHNFPTTIEKLNGKLGRVVIDITDPSTITDRKKKFDLFVTIPGRMDKVQDKGGKLNILKSEQGFFEFKVRKKLYESYGSCYHRFFNPKGMLGAQDFGVEARAKKEKKKFSIDLITDKS